MFVPNFRWLCGVLWQVQISRCISSKSKIWWRPIVLPMHTQLSPRKHVDSIGLASRLLDFIHVNLKTEYNGAVCWNLGGSEQQLYIYIHIYIDHIYSYIIFAVLCIDQFATLQPISAPHGSFDQQLQEPTNIDGHNPQIGWSKTHFQIHTVCCTFLWVDVPKFDG